MTAKRMTQSCISILRINVAEEARLEFRLRSVDETNYILDEIRHYDFMSKIYKKTLKYVNYIEHFLTVASAITGCVSISAFTSLVRLSVGIRSSATEITICASAAVIKRDKSIL